MKNIIQRVNFVRKQEVIDANKYAEEEAWLDRQYRSRRFHYYAEVFELDVDSWLFDELTKKQSEQLGALWKLVDLEGGQR